MKALAAVLACLMASGAAAQTNCQDRDIVTHKLRQQHKERFEGGGKASALHVFEVWVSPRTNTWTILRTSKNGKSCIMASGVNWRPRAWGVPG